MYSHLSIDLILTLLGHGPYRYTEHLLKLAACRPVSVPPLPEYLCHINTPLMADAWRVALADHPNKSYVDYILHGITEGFRIGFNYSCLISSHCALSHSCSALLAYKGWGKKLLVSPSCFRWLNLAPSKMTFSLPEIHGHPIVGLAKICLIGCVHSVWG